jgi:hypothetical protein
VSESEVSHSARGRLDSADIDATPTIGQGMAAVRAMYAGADSGGAIGVGASRSNVPFQESDTVGSAEPGGGEGVETGTWIQCYDEESGWPYVYNEATGEVRWVEPDSADQLMADLWDVCYDEQGNEFYYNQVRCACSL